MSPRRLVMLYFALCAGSLIVAAVFTARGAWYVLVFAILELLAVGTAFFLYARHASDREHIALTGNCLLIELIQSEQVRQFRLDPRTTRIRVPESSGELVGLQARGVQIQVGRFVTERKRREFARELRQALACRE